MAGAKRKLARPQGAKKSARMEAAKVSDHSEPESAVEMLSDEDLEGGFEDLEDDGADLEAMAEDDGEDGDADDDDDEAAGVAPAEGGADVSNSVPDARFAVPSLDEIHGLKETSELYMNNVFKLQLDEMMRQVRPDLSLIHI